ncbi:alpha/beta fold hydrolase [Paenibacillaceae bacterium WGS1546]|uniref:alpha/beta fold hydrolase n=1 Tax=Cohnella sp. WGS1546 TaxID=3366810 RepID=UPI00372D78B2
MDRVQVRENGNNNAPLILFLHGGGVSGWMWEQQMRDFAAYRCLAPDLPGHGSKHADVGFSIQRSAEEYIRLLEENANGQKIIVVGFSLGAQVLIQMLSMKPNLIDCAIINSALVKPMKIAKRWIGPTIKMSHPLVKIRWFSKLQARTLYIPEKDFERYYEESCRMKQETLARVMEENMSFEIPPGFREATGSILVTVGAKEKAVMKKSAAEIVQANPNCRGAIIPNIGHGASLAMPDFFNRMAEDWIREGAFPERCKEIG